MMTNAYRYMTVLFLSTFIVSCSSSVKTTETVTQLTSVGSVNGKQVDKEELVTQYLKGNPGNDYTSEEIREFLPVYLDYLAKLEMAEDAGYYENPAVLDEYDIYSKQAAYAYWLDNVIRPTLFNEFKSRYERVLKSSHILISVDPDAAPADTLEAYNKLIAAREQFANGTTIEELDGIYSTKRQGRSMGGDLPWFSVGTTVKDFEDVLYSLDVGELSMPFRTQFGYHIVLLEKEMQRIPDRYTSHIFLRSDRSPAPLDSALYKLRNGASWPEIVKEYTMDTPSASSGGVIGWINYGSRYDAEFIDTIMKLAPDSAYSGVIRSSYGYHILRIDSVRSFNNEEARDAFILNQLESSTTFRKSNSFITEWLDENYGRYTNEALLNDLTGAFLAADSLTFSDFNARPFSDSDTLYRFDDKVYSSVDFVEYLDESGRGPLTKNYMSVWFKYFKEAMIDEDLVDFTLQEYPDFSEQTDNYLNGLVVYQINEDSVWSAATVDTSILKSRFEADSEKYQFSRRPYYHLITSTRDSSMQKAITFVNEGNHPDSIRTAGIAVGVSRDSTSAFSGEPFDMLMDMEEGSFSEIFEYKSRNAVFYLNRMLPARPMTFDEAFDRVLADYQPEREEQWLQRLRERYNVISYPQRIPINEDEAEQN